MSDDDSEFRFSPEELDDEGPRADGLDPAPLILAACVGVGGALFLAEPVVDPIAVGSLELRAVVLSAVVIAGGLLFGSGVYLRRGKRLLGVAHAVGGVGWTLVVLGTLLGQGDLLLVGMAVLVVGAFALGAVAFGRG